MNTNVWTWLLAGALVASLAWNLRGALAAPPESETAPAPGASCRLEPLALDSEVRARLREICAAACSAAESDEARARSLGSELFERLADPAADADDLRARAREVARLRGRTLQRCVDAVLEARQVLEPDELEGLVRACLAAPPAEDRAGSCCPPGE